MTAGSETDSRPLTARRLVRIHKGRKIAGVCTGLGDYFNMDPTVVRLLWLALVLAYGMGLLLYLILWLVVPLETERYGEQTKTV
ncbi:PspC domain-containing protein [candidate division KSB1 bacterium]|nr:MAG: PspC domain-containing protein [candidate division KSB1 bacterium]